MRLIQALLSAAALLAVAGGCGDSGTNNTGDMPMSSQDLAMSTGGHDMAGPLSQCGHPGDVGNSKGVGKFCLGFSECANQPASICSALGNGGTPSSSDTYFCTIIGCATTQPPPDCGPGATCVSDPQGRGSACTPNSCLGPTDM
jgi:hypothetical protein